MGDDNLSDDITELRREVRELHMKIDELVRVCGRMDEHITFVNTTYSVVRSPLSWLMGRINYYATGNTIEDTSLPTIPDKASTLDLHSD